MECQQTVNISSQHDITAAMTGLVKDFGTPLLIIMMRTKLTYTSQSRRSSPQDSVHRPEELAPGQPTPFGLCREENTRVLLNKTAALWYCCLIRADHVALKSQRKTVSLKWISSSRTLSTSCLGQMR